MRQNSRVLQTVETFDCLSSSPSACVLTCPDNSKGTMGEALSRTGARGWRWVHGLAVNHMDGSSAWMCHEGFETRRCTAIPIRNFESVRVALKASKGA